MLSPVKLLCALIATALLATLTACSDKPKTAAESAPKPTVDTFTAHGTVVQEIGMGDAGSDLDAICAEQFASIVGRQVPVKDPSGTVVSYGVLSDATGDLAEGDCTATWDAEDIPATTDVLSYTIGENEPVLFKQADADDLTARLQ